MGAFRLTNKAVEDLASIWEYTRANWSEKHSSLWTGMQSRKTIKRFLTNPSFLGVQVRNDGLWKIVGIKGMRLCRIPFIPSPTVNTSFRTAICGEEPSYPLPEA